jgi:hypothetical protein
MISKTAILFAIGGCTVLALGACTNSKTYMKNPKTGDVITCGGLHPYTVVESAVQRREAQCIQDYKDQGFVRIPGPADSK